ncbi:hypothetical protein WA1_13830 [Scytonema hofmannii PCC 7110]|uniref:Uncharacterized protein n=1 Tax=Scytonema hofmannii PCC 7110 TaxID=128403 RepID=A0A139XET1_9CYAN|nr:hypothetical protein WA1_13830 [Scytonema hofmannii PCC 7110]
MQRLPHEINSFIYHLNLFGIWDFGLRKLYPDDLIFFKAMQARGASQFGKNTPEMFVIAPIQAKSAQADFYIKST